MYCSTVDGHVDTDDDDVEVANEDDLLLLLLLVLMMDPPRGGVDKIPKVEEEDESTNADR